LPLYATYTLPFLNPPSGSRSVNPKESCPDPPVSRSVDVRSRWPDDKFAKPQVDYRDRANARLLDWGTRATRLFTASAYTEWSIVLVSKAISNGVFNCAFHRLGAVLLSSEQLGLSEPTDGKV